MVLEDGRLVDGVGVLMDDLEVALLLILRGSGELDGLGLGHLLFFKHLLLVDRVGASASHLRLRVASELAATSLASSLVARAITYLAIGRQLSLGLVPLKVLLLFVPRGRGRSRRDVSWPLAFKATLTELLLRRNCHAVIVVVGSIVGATATATKVRP